MIPNIGLSLNTLVYITVMMLFQNADALVRNAEEFVPGHVSGVAEFQVNSYNLGDQVLPKVARIAGGGSVAVWQSYEQQQPGSVAVVGQRYNPDGSPLGSEFAISVGTGMPLGNHGAPTVSGLADGGFVVVWQSSGSQRVYLYAKLFSVTGEPISDRFIHVTSDDIYASCPPEVAGFNQGGFVVVWCGEFVQSSAMVAKRYTQQGKELGQIQTFGSSVNYDKKPNIAVFSDDRYLVTWSDLYQETKSNDVYGQILAGYHTVGPRFRLSASSDGIQVYSSVAVLSNDDFVAVWASLSGSTFDIYARRYNSVGEPVIDEWLVNEYTVSTQTKPHVAAISGGYVFTWESFGQDGQEYAIIVREYSADTNLPVSSEFVANTMALGSQTEAHVVSHSEITNQYFVIWSDSINDGSSSGIFGTILGTAASPPTQTAPIDDFQINTITTGYQRYPEVCTLMNGGVVVVWESKTDSGIDVIAQIYTSDGDKVGNPITMDTQSSDHYSPTVVAINDGGFLVVFLTRESMYDRTHFQRFNAAGTRIGGDNTDYESTGGKPVVATFQSGGWVLGMSSLSSLSISVVLQRFTSSGNKVGPKVYPISAREVQSIGLRIHMFLSDSYLLTWSEEDVNQVGVIAVWGLLFTPNAGVSFRLSATTSDQQITPDAAVINGGFVAVWTSMDPTTGNYDVFSRRFSNDGTPLETTNRKLNIETSKNQLNPRVTKLNNGDYFVAWESWSADDSYLGVVGIQFSGLDNTRLTDEIVLNTNTPWNQYHGSVTPIGRDRIFAAWTDAKLDGDHSGIFGRIIEVAASPTSEEQVVNTGTVSNQGYSTVANLTSGGCVICWDSYGHEAGSANNNKGIFCQRYNSFGIQEGSEFQANTHIEDNQLYPSAVGLPNGGFAVVWNTEVTGTSLRDVRGRVFSSSGTPLGDDFVINTNTNGYDHMKPSVCSLSDSRFVVTWDGSVGQTTTVFAQILSSGGAKVGLEIIIPTNLPVFNTKALPNIASFADDNFVISYTDDDGSSVGIACRIFDGSGQPIGSKIDANVNTFTTQFNSDVSVLSDGSFVVVWAHYNWNDNAKHDIYARRFSPAGIPIDVNEFMVNVYFDGYQNFPKVTGLSSGGFAVAWETWGADGNYYGVAAREYSSSAKAISTELLCNKNTDGHQEHPSISSFGSYGYVVSWDDPTLDGDRKGIVARFYTKTYLGEL
eukprot:TRINITY_DN16140_c0_g1_i1.p1 TRINITY_DN16140_c0_g1~~TRINITY_DN16140_c0_g1_i1.p1  ORF type:complete len:1196 (+),score=240.60 TRINITY_DN16140_c0_g1_i1:73-3660(+)